MSAMLRATLEQGDGVFGIGGQLYRQSDFVD
jgi:hypothetical protein